MNGKTILFDLDGTVLNTLPDLREATNYAMRALGYPERTDADVRRFLGNGAAVLMKLSLPEGASPEIMEEAVRLHKSYYLQHLTEETLPYPGILEMLNRLKKEGYGVGLVSNKNDEAVQKLMGAFFPGIFDGAAGEQDGLPKKPAPDLPRRVLETMGQRGAGKLIYVGDSEVDLKTAENLGAVPILVGWGFRDREELERLGEIRIASDPEELFRMIQEV